MREVFEALSNTQAYWRAMCHFLAGGTYHEDAVALRELPVAARVHCFGRALQVHGRALECLEMVWRCVNMSTCSPPTAQTRLYFTTSRQVILWDTPHYRCESWRTDMRNNLRNVALPGTHFPLSILCSTRSSSLGLIWRPAIAMSSPSSPALSTSCRQTFPTKQGGVGGLSPLRHSDLLACRCCLPGTGPAGRQNCLEWLVQ